MGRLNGFKRQLIFSLQIRAASCLHACGCPDASSRKGEALISAAASIDAVLDVQLAQLQPLKHRHFERRTLYLAIQIKEVRCMVR